jgi:indolepyruvate ferredoxin oxidoreductase
VLHPGNVAEYLEFGLYGWGAEPFSGNWVGFKAISEVVESGMTVDLDAVPLDFEHPVDFTPASPLHIRLVDLPSLQLEERLQHKLAAVRAFAQLNSVDKHIVSSPAASLGIVTVGKAHFDFMEVLRRLDLDPNALAAAGVRVYKVGLVYPLEATRILAFAQGLTDLLVIEEKAPVVERQIKELLFHQPAFQRPRVVGKTDETGAPLLSELGELRPSRIMAVVAEWLARLNPALDRRHLVVDFTAPALLGNAADATRRQPYFCSGCPHNTSTKLPEGSRALAGIGCHFMANWMERGTSGLVQMGAEGVDWAAGSRFSDAPHVFPEPRRRHLLPLRLSGDPPGHRGARQHHLQDPLQRRGGDDRRPAGRRPDLGAADCAPGRGRGREASGRRVGRDRQVRRPPGPVPARHELS